MIPKAEQPLGPQIGESIEPWLGQLQGTTMHNACSLCKRPVGLDNECSSHGLVEGWTCASADFFGNQDLYIDVSGIRRA